MPSSITLLHLSDPQFGKNHRFGSEEPFDTLCQRLEDDLGQLRDGEQGLRPDLVVLTGDLAEWGRRGEFDQAFELLARLSDFLDVPRRHVAVIPGNHDVDRKACEAYFAECASDEVEPQPPYYRKWRHWVRTFHTFYLDLPALRFTEDEPWTLYEMPELRLVVAGLNSTMAESHRDEDHYGHVGERQLRWFRERLTDYRERGWLRVGAVHHNMVMVGRASGATLRGATRDDENLRDVDDFVRVLGLQLNVVLHGHTHDGKLHWLGQKLPVVSTGSAALESGQRPGEVPNQYQVLRFSTGRLERFARCYAPGQKRWIGDTRFSESGGDWIVAHEVAFEDVGGTLDDAPGAAPRPEVRFRDEERVPRDDFLARVERVCRLRARTDAEIQGVRRDTPVPYLAVTESVGEIAGCYAVGAWTGDIDDATLDAFLTVHRRYQQTDPACSRPWSTAAPRRPRSWCAGPLGSASGYAASSSTRG